MSKAYNYKKIKSLISMIQDVEIKETPRVYPPSSSDLNVVLFYTNVPKIPISANLNVSFEKSHFSYPDGIIFETEFKNILKFLKEIKGIQFDNTKQNISSEMEPLQQLISELDATIY